MKRFQTVIRRRTDGFMWLWIILFVLFVILVYAIEKWDKMLWEKAIHENDFWQKWSFLKKKNE